MEHRKQQYSIFGLMFVVAGVAIFCAVAPALQAASFASPSWLILASIEMLFAWAMIPLCNGPKRIWWVGFLLGGLSFLPIGMQADRAIAHSRTLAGLGELPVLVGFLSLSLLFVVGFGFVGGSVLVVLQRQVERFSPPSDK